MKHNTAWNDIRHATELYQEWTGREIPANQLWIDSHLVVIRDDGKVVGVAQIIVIDDPVWNRMWGLVENVYVRKGNRRKGIGGELMSKVETQARLLGCKYIKMFSYKNEGKALYRSLNYEEGSAFAKDF